jgi:hypothetical protein
MAKTNSFKIAELIRGISFDVDNDVITTTKSINSKNKARGNSTRTATTEFAIDTFSKTTYRVARYIVSMSKGSAYHSTEVILVHEGSNVILTSYGTLKSETLATIDADISGSDVRLLVTPSSATSTVIKFDRTLVEA